MSSRLVEIKARVEIVAAKPEGHEPTPTELSAAKHLTYQDVPVLVAAVEAVLKLHKPRVNPTGFFDPLCDYCTGEYENGWPCDTVRAIQSALGEAE